MAPAGHSGHHYGKGEGLIELKRHFMKTEVRLPEAPDLLLWYNNIWILAGAEGAVSFEIAEPFELEGQKYWGDAYLLTHRPAEMLSEAEKRFGEPHPDCPVLEVPCHEEKDWEPGLVIKAAWMLNNFDEEEIYSQLEEYYVITVRGEGRR